MTNTLDEAKREVKEQLIYRSEIATQSARWLAIAVVAVIWGVLVLGDGADLVTTFWQRIGLLIALSFALLGLGADWLQAMVGYININKAYDRVHAKEFKLDDGIYPKDQSRRMIYRFFFAKLILAPISAILLIVCLAYGVITNGASTNEMPDNQNNTVTALVGSKLAEKLGIADEQRNGFKNGRRRSRLN